MGSQFNITNKFTFNAVFKTTISVTIRVGSIVATAIFYHRREWDFGTISLAVSALAWMQTFTGVPPFLALIALGGGEVDWVRPDGKGRVRLSGYPGSRVGVGAVLCLVAVAVVAVLIPGVLHASAGATVRTSSRASQTGSAPGREATRNAPGPTAVVQMYYTAINNRDWPRAWRLLGNGPARGAAYGQMIAGYRCTVHDWVTGITSNGDSTLVHLRALESDGTVAVEQRYWLRYVIRDGLIKEGTSLGVTGNPPPGC